jgi:hypothetical protein
MLDSEVARLAGVDRKLVRHWAMRAGINVSKRRAARLRETWRSKIETGHLPKFRGSINREKGEGRGKDATPVMRHPEGDFHRKGWEMTNRLGQLLWTGVVRNIPGQRKGWRLSMSIASGPDAWRAGSLALAVIVQSKVIAVTDGGPDRFTVADAPEIVRRSMARANHGAFR